MTTTDSSQDFFDLDGGMLLLIDTRWHPSPEQPDPPIIAVVGGWVIDETGQRGRFQPNPAYRPSTPDSPLDPVDEILRRLGGDPEAADELPDALLDASLGIAVDPHGTALVRTAPDGFPVVLVATAPGHRRHIETPDWRDLDVETLAKALPPQGIDVLLNPGSPASLRLRAEVVREIARNSG